MKTLFTTIAVAVALLAAPISVQVAGANDAHHPGQATKTDQKKKPKPKPRAAIAPAQQSGTSLGEIAVG